MFFLLRNRRIKHETKHTVKLLMLQVFWAVIWKFQSPSNESLTSQVESEAELGIVSFTFLLWKQACWNQFRLRDFSVEVKSLNEPLYV